ncbi:MAG: hypothetical protein ACK55I_34160, partial [bacterium]
MFNRLLKKSYGYITPAFGVMFLFLCLIVFLQACKSGDSKSAADERVIARVYDQVLYAADLKNLVPPG